MLLLVPMAASVCSCSEPTVSDMLVGRWVLETATETVSQTPGAVEVNDLPGFEGQTLELSENGVCRRVDRTDTILCEWYLAAGNKLLLVKDNIVSEDYDIYGLTNELLGLSHAYISYDSTTAVRTHCLYKFKYRKR